MSRALPLRGPSVFHRLALALGLATLLVVAAGGTAALAADQPAATVCTDVELVDPALVADFEHRFDMLRLGVADPPRLIPRPFSGLPPTGDVKILTLLIDFTDWKGKNQPMTIHTRLFGDGTDPSEYPYESLRNYYRRSSYGLLNITGNTLGWYHYPGPRSEIPETREGRQAVISQALQAFDPVVDFSQFDNDHDGDFDYLIISWAGPDTGGKSFWWANTPGWLADAGALTLDGVTPDRYSWQPECVYAPGYDPSVGQAGRTTDGNYDQNVIMHETGHALGLPDLYGPTGGVGGIDMMDRGTGDLGCFTKWLLGWITPTPISWVTRTRILPPSGTSPSAYVVMPDASADDPFTEFFMVQNRTRVGNDAPCASPRYGDMPGDGLLVWHVDATLTQTENGLNFLYSNPTAGRKLIKLVEADGLEEIETTYGTGAPPYGWADAEDYFTVGSSFGPDTTPSSARYDGSASGVEVRAIVRPPYAWVTSTSSLQATLVGGYDHTAPTTFVTGADRHWHDAPVTLTFAARDTGGSGVLRTEYSLDGGRTYARGTSVIIAAPADGSNDGTHNVFVRSLDVAENVEDAQVVTVRIDAAPPVTTATAPKGWKNTDVTVKLSATDKGAGVEATVYWTAAGMVGSGSEATVHADPAEHSADGVTTLSFCSMDALGRWEAAKTVAVRIDTRRPVPRAPSPASCRFDGTATLLYKVVDTRPSCGRAHVTIKIKDSSGTLVKRAVLRSKPVNKLLKYSFPCSLRRGTYRFYVSAKDLAGNLSLRSATNKLTVN